MEKTKKASRGKTVRTLRIKVNRGVSIRYRKASCPVTHVFHLLHFKQTATYKEQNVKLLIMM